MRHLWQFVGSGNNLRSKIACASVLAGVAAYVWTQHQHAKPKHAVLLLGAPGVGKSTQTKLISELNAKVMCISTGDLVRKLNKKVQDNVSLTPVEARAAKSLENMRQGGLMDSSAVYALLFSYLSLGGEGHKQYLEADTIIFDGAVKEFNDINYFEEALKAFNAQGNKIALNQIINISASEDDLIKRQISRVTEAEKKGIPQRPDDNPEIYAKRLRNYLVKTEQVLGYYRTMNFVNLESSGGIQETKEQLIVALNLANPKFNLPTNQNNRVSIARFFKPVTDCVSSFYMGSARAAELPIP